MAFSDLSGESAALPSVEGKPLFKPSRAATIAVGIVLILFGLLVATTSGMLQIGVPKMVLVWLSYALALGLFARAVGDFKYVGFFKRVRGSRFARLDTLVYSPLSLMLAAGVAGIASRQSA
ncbi:MAG: DUF3995 domain-containing protein [Aeromicrobium sp.]|nr:DUF3995 domain-containing protein [Burkholderiales bacterium]